MNPTIRQFYNKVPAVAGLAVVGLFVAICGLIGMFAPQQKEPTSMTLAELEGSDTLPKKNWLELKEGHFYWVLAKRTEKAKTVYVPFVSRGLMGKWIATSGKYPAEKLRIWVKIDKDRMKAKYSEVLDNLEGQKAEALARQMLKSETLKGVTSSVRDEPRFVRDSLEKDATGWDDTKILVLELDKEPKGVGILGGLCFLIIGLALAVPLVLRLKRGPLPETEAGGLEPSFTGGLEAGIRAGIAAGVEDALAQHRQQAQAPPAPAPPALVPAAAPQPAPAQPAEFYVAKNNQRLGPMTLSQLRGMAAAGQLAPNDPVWKPGMANWVPASSVLGIFG